MRLAFLVKHRHIWPVSWLCEVLEVSRPGFHAWFSRPRTREIHDTKLVAAIEKSFQASDRTYGARRVGRGVLDEGLACGLHRIERLMRINALRARPKRWGKPKDDGERSLIAVMEPANVCRWFRHRFEKPEACRSRAPERSGPGFRGGPAEPQVAGRFRFAYLRFSYIWTAEGWLYVAPRHGLSDQWRSHGSMLDLFFRRAVGWSLKGDRDASLVMDALMMAVWRREKAVALLHHLDQGSQYRGGQFQRLLADNWLICLMSRAGNVWDNSTMESLFSTLKTERTARKVYRTRNEARADVFDYIERFYSPRRRHSELGYISPMEFEACAMLA